MSIKNPTSFHKKPPLRDVSSLKEAAWFNNGALSQIFSLLNKEGQEVRVVGGAVRNHLCDEPVIDVDLATTWHPDGLIAQIKNAGLTFIPTGIEHGTLTLMIDELSFEITSLRADVKTDGRHAIVEFGTDWGQDAQRRDFTMNALYVSSDGKLHDPLGTGLQDLEARHVRFIGVPGQRIQEDYLRILRFFRFAASYSDVPYDEGALRACLEHRDGLQQLSAERIAVELIKILTLRNPRDVLICLYQNGFLCSLLGCAPNLLPTLRLIDIEQSLGIAANRVLRLALLTVYHKGDSARIAARLRLSKSQEKTLSVLGDCPVIDSFSGEEKNLQLFKNAHYLLGKDRFRKAFLASWAKSAQSINNERLSELYHLSIDWPCVEFPVGGQDLIDAGISPGPALGAVLKELERIWLVGNMDLTKENLLEGLKPLDLNE